MTESEWLLCQDPQAMLAFLRTNGKTSERKLRLLHCACCRQVWEFLPGERSRHAVRAVESYTDGRADLDTLRVAADAAVKEWSVCEIGFVAPAATASLWRLEQPRQAPADDYEPLEMAESIVQQVAFEGRWLFADISRGTQGRRPS
jgi:hypothetical protein